MQEPFSTPSPSTANTGAAASADPAANADGRGPAGRPETGKRQRMNRLCDENGRFAMLAIDQRGSLRRMLARRRKVEIDTVDEHDLRLVKRVVTDAVAPLATAVLTDPIYGYPSTIGDLPKAVGLLVSTEITGYVLHGAEERRSRLVDGWDAESALRGAVDAVKLLIWHHPEASPATGRHQRELVEAVGAACSVAGLPFVLEVVTYAMNGTLGSDAEFARVKPDLVVDGAKTYSDPKFGVDLLKLQFPADLKYTEEYRSGGLGRGEPIYGLAEVRAVCERLDAASEVPWVILSAGVEPEEFVDNIRLANAAGASGFLCGRAVWQHVVEHFPDEARMRAYMHETGRAYFRRICEANEAARSWYAHRRFRNA